MFHPSEGLRERGALGGLRGQAPADMSAAAGGPHVFTSEATLLASFRAEITCTEQPSCWEGFSQGS